MLDLALQSKYSEQGISCCTGIESDPNPQSLVDIKFELKLLKVNVSAK